MSEQDKPIRKTWTMYKRAIPPIVPTRPIELTDVRYEYLYDAQWNTANGHDKNATQWQYIEGTSTNECNKRNLNIVNGTWVNNNYLQFDGTGYLIPETQGNFSLNTANELYFVEGIGTIYSKTKKETYNTTRSLEITENAIIYKHTGKTVTVNVPSGKDIRMIYIYYGNVVAYDKNGNKYRVNGNISTTTGLYVDTVKFFDGFVGKVYAFREQQDYKRVNGLTRGNGNNFTYECLDAEFEYAKNRFKW